MNIILIDNKFNLLSINEYVKVNNYPVDYGFLKYQ